MNQTNRITMEIIVHDKDLRLAAEQGMDAFLSVFTDAIGNAIGGELTADTMGRLNAHQITLWGYHLLHEEVMDGGIVQLIHNGYAPFFFQNPFAKAMRLWGLKDLCKLVYKAKDLYDALTPEEQHTLTVDCSDEDFMALFEQFPQFDEVDDEFVENEEDYTARICRYVDENLGLFATVTTDPSGVPNEK